MIYQKAKNWVPIGYVVWSLCLGKEVDGSMVLGGLSALKTWFTVSGRRRPQRGSRWRSLASWTRDWSLRQKPAVFPNPEPKKAVWFLGPKRVPCVFPGDFLWKEEGTIYIWLLYPATCSHSEMHFIAQMFSSLIFWAPVPLRHLFLEKSLICKFALSSYWQVRCNELVAYLSLNSRNSSHRDESLTMESKPR